MRKSVLAISSHTGSRVMKGLLMRSANFSNKRNASTICKPEINCHLNFPSTALVWIRVFCVSPCNMNKLNMTLKMTPSLFITGFIFREMQTAYKQVFFVCYLFTQYAINMHLAFRFNYSFIHLFIRESSLRFIHFIHHIHSIHEFILDWYVIP